LRNPTWQRELNCWDSFHRLENLFEYHRITRTRVYRTRVYRSQSSIDLIWFKIDWKIFRIKQQKGISMIICSQLKTLSVISSKFFRKKEKRKKGKKVRVNVFLDVRSVILDHLKETRLILVQLIRNSYFHINFSLHKNPNSNDIFICWNKSILIFERKHYAIKVQHSNTLLKQQSRFDSNFFKRNKIEWLAWNCKISQLWWTKHEQFFDDEANLFCCKHSHQV
jgi:hypothetical protein